MGQKCFVMPVAVGNRTGLGGWQNAASAASLPSLVRTLPCGSEVWLRADAGSYPPLPGPLLFTANQATPDQSIWVHGVDANGLSMKANFLGTRNAPYRAGASSGAELIRLLAGANNLRFTDMEFTNVGVPFRIGADVSNIALGAMLATNVQRFIEDYASGTAGTASVAGLKVQQVDIHGFSKAAILLKYASHNLLIEDVNGDSQGQDGDNFAIGVHLDDTAHDATIRRVTMQNCVDTVDTYQNGDGFATERGVYNVVFDTTTSSGNTDAGYDIKSSATTLLNPVARGNKRNFRLWATDTSVENPVGDAPIVRGGIGSQAQVWMNAGAKATITGATFTDTSPNTIVFDLEDGADLTFDGTVSRDPASQLSRLGEGSRFTSLSSL